MSVRERGAVVLVAICALLSACGDDRDGEGTADDSPADMMKAAPDDGPPPDPRTCDTDSTWAALQVGIFERHGCVEAACHGKQAAGDLDLRANAAYESLLRVAASASLTETTMRVEPGAYRESFLYEKLAAKTLETALPAGAGAPMPSNAGRLAQAELEALRVWIMGGAPETGFVLGTDALFEACDAPPPASPLKVAPLAPPDEQLGFQLYAPPWEVSPQDEDEVCYATYYDLSGRVPEDARIACPEALGGPGQTCVSIHDTLLLQDAQSHHSIIYLYTGDAAPGDPSWGGFACLGGERAGTVCDPTRIGEAAAVGGADCGPRSACASEVRSSIACLGWGPPDRDRASRTVGGTQTSRESQRFVDGVYAVMPLTGTIIWNSHAYNWTDEATTVEQYYNLYYAKPDDQVYRLRSVFDDDEIFVMDVPPFERREYCETTTLPRGTRLTRLGSHVHERGVLFRTWLPPHEPCDGEGDACSVPQSEPDYVSRIYNDATVLDFDPPLAFDNEDDRERTLRFCAVFDNGSEDPTSVKRQSRSPETPADLGVPLGGPCEDEDRYCIGGDHHGEPCGTDMAFCGEGSCDACPLRGGVTTQDEMMILTGAYYVVDPDD